MIAFRIYGHVTTITSGLAARGRQIFFFQTRFSRQPLEVSPKFFQGRVPPGKLYLTSGGQWVGGQIWGPGPQRKFFFIFFCGTSPGDGGRNLSYKNHSNGGPLWCLKFKKNSSIFFFIEFKVFGGGALCWDRPLGGFCPPPDPYRFWS